MSPWRDFREAVAVAVMAAIAGGMLGWGLSILMERLGGV